MAMKVNRKSIKKFFISNSPRVIEIVWLKDSINLYKSVDDFNKKRTIK